MINKCSRCNSEKLFVEITTNKYNKYGLYCGECGKWVKWLKRPEVQIAKYREYKIIKTENSDTNRKC